MKRLSTGTYFGETVNVVQVPGVILSQVTYQPAPIDWHTHENAFFSLVLQGKMVEHTPKGTSVCPPGTLLFQNWDEKHYTDCPRVHAGFYVELQKCWFEHAGIGSHSFRGNLEVKHPAVKILFHQVYRETRSGDGLSPLVIEELLHQAFDWLGPSVEASGNRTPNWVCRLVDMLHSLPDEKLTLELISREMGVHRGHICRYFAKHFHCTVGEYARNLKVERALNLLRDSRHSLTDIAYLCGFADQSHFTRIFKAVTQKTPLHYRKILLGSER